MALCRQRAKLGFPLLGPSGDGGGAAWFHCLLHRSYVFGTLYLAGISRICQAAVSRENSISPSDIIATPPQRFVYSLLMTQRRHKLSETNRSPPGNRTGTRTRRYAEPSKPSSSFHRLTVSNFEL